MGLNPLGRNWGPEVNWDDLGKFYAGFIIAWTIILYAGVTCLILNRHVAFIRIRNLPLAIAAISALHIYLVKIFLAYTTNGNFSCSAEFWIMSIYLPFGIALFQANLAQLKSISDQQCSLLVQEPKLAQLARVTFLKALYLRWKSLPALMKSYVAISLGMIIQLVVTGVLYATTPTLQGDWSVWEPISHAHGQGLCRKSLQWIPSAFWQLAWSWLFGPYLLLRVRNIRDTHYWRIQVMISVIAGLPGTPLWLAALYSPKFKPVNKWFVPPMWIAPGIIVIQFTTIFFPVYEIYKSKSEMRETLNILKLWQDRRDDAQAKDHLMSGSTSRASYDTPRSISTTASSRRHRETCSMASLEKALDVNPSPLLRFAATKDFTAENVLFLMQVRQWRTAFQAAIQLNAASLEAIKTHFFNSAVQIYISRVNERTAEFPINIEGKMRQELDTIFKPAVPSGKLSLSTKPTEFEQPQREQIPPFTPSIKQPGENTGPAKLFDYENVGDFSTSMSSSGEKGDHMFESHPCVAPLGASRATIRAGFDEHVFDKAETSIRYLVLTNTWQKFVKFGEHSSNVTISA